MGELKKLKEVVLIDDCEADNFLHSLVIEGTGLVEKVTVFDWAIDALEYFKSPTPPEVDLIFLDINMPRMDGFQFLEEFKKLEFLPKPFVLIMLTTSILEGDKQKFQELGGKEYLGKPLTEEAFLDIVAKLQSDQA